MTIFITVVEKMKKIIPNLPDDWAETVGERIGITKEVVRSYTRGDRGKRNKKRALDILRTMKELESEFKAEIYELTQK